MNAAFAVCGVGLGGWGLGFGIEVGWGLGVEGGWRFLMSEVPLWS